MITVIEGGYIVEKTKVKDIYKLIGFNSDKWQFRLYASYLR